MQNHLDWKEIQELSNRWIIKYQRVYKKCGDETRIRGYQKDTSEEIILFQLNFQFIYLFSK